MIDKEQMNTLKFLVIGSFVIGIGGVIASILFRRENPEIASWIKTGGFIIAILVFSGGIFWTIAGKTLSKKFTVKRSPQQVETDYKRKLANQQLELEQLKMETELNRERAKQKQMDNQIALQKAKINQLNSSTKKTTGGGNDVLGNLGGFLSMNQQPQQPQQQQPVRRVKKKKKKVVKTQVKKQPNMDDFFIKF